MTLREFIRNALELTKDLDAEIQVRVVFRDGYTGCVRNVRHLPITMVSQFSGPGMKVCVEFSDLNRVKPEEV
jgi:hypothetical protein